MKQKHKPSNLGLKIGTKKEAAWTRIKESLEQKEMEGEIESIINKVVIELAEREIEKEKNLNS